MCESLSCKTNDWTLWCCMAPSVTLSTTAQKRPEGRNHKPHQPGGDGGRTQAKIEERHGGSSGHPVRFSFHPVSTRGRGTVLQEETSMAGASCSKMQQCGKTRPPLCSDCSLGRCGQVMYGGGAVTLLCSRCAVSCSGQHQEIAKGGTKREEGVARETGLPCATFSMAA